MEFFLQLAILILVAKALGEIAERLRLPSIIGYLLAGIVLGQHALNLVPADGEGVVIFAQLGAILLLFVAGVRELRLRDLIQNKIGTFGAAFLGYAFPFLAVVYVMTNIGNIAPGISFSFEQVILLATALSMSSVITSVKTLIHLNKFNTFAGRTILSTAIIDAMGGLLIFTLLSTFVMTAALDIPKVIGITALTAAFFLVFLLADKIVPTILRDAIILRVEEAQFTIAFVVMLALAWLAEMFGLNGIIGAFLAGIIISKTSFRESGFAGKLSSMSYGIFIPVFFAWVGLQFVPEWSIFIPLLVVMVLASNFLGTWFGCRLGNIVGKDALTISVGMLPRGGIDLVLLAAAKNLGILSGVAGDLIFTSVIMLIFVSVAITPPALKAVVQ